MKFQSSLALLSLVTVAMGASAQASTRKIPNLGPGVNYITYYGVWSDKEVAAAHNARLVITVVNDHYFPSKDIVGRIQKGADGVKGTKDDVAVIAYLTIGEHKIEGGQPAVGNGSGPTQFDASGKITGKANKGVASFYVDACQSKSKDGDKFHGVDGKPDVNGEWGSFFVNPADPEWRKLLKAEADMLLKDYGADGLFLDTLDSAMPKGCEDGGGYASLLPAMSDTVKWLYESYSNKYMVANRGFFLFKDGPHNIRPYVSALMTENHFTEWDYDKKAAVKSPYDYSEYAKLLNAEAQKPDGFQILVLDYLSETQDDCAKIQKWQSDQVQKAGNGRWMNFVSPAIDLDVISFTGCKK